MRKPMRRLAAVVAAAALSLSLSACVAPGWVYDSPPAAGTQVDVDGLKLRNFLIITDEASGDAILVGAITARDAEDQVVGMAYAPEADDGSFGAAQELQFTESIRKGQTIYLDGSVTQFNNEELLVGRLAQVSVSFGSGAQAELSVPVMSATHADFAVAWEDAHS